MPLFIATLLTKLLIMAGIGNYVVQESKFVIIKSEMSESMKRHALGTAMVAFEEPGIPINSKKSDIAIKLAEEFDHQYGKHWFCLVGPPGFVSHFDYVEGTLLWFSYKDIQVIMFRMSRPSQTDVIKDARRTDKNKVKIVECEMSETMKAQAITTAIIAFQEFNTYEKISNNISGVFDQMHGEYWQCVIGPHGFNARFNYIAGTYLAFSFGDAQVVMFQIMKQIEPHEVIMKARSHLYHPIIDYNSLETQVRNQVVRVAIENIYRFDTFIDIARGITSHLSATHGYEWACVLGHNLFHGEDVPECHSQAVSVHFGDLRVLLCAVEILDASEEYHDDDKKS